MRHPTTHIFEFTPDSMEAWCAERRLPKFRAQQILEWVYAKGVSDPEKMSNLAKADRAMLAREITTISGDIVGHQKSTDGVEKLLVEWWDGSSPDSKAVTAPGDGDLNPEPKPLISTSLPVLTRPASGNTDRQTECVMIPSEDRRTACISSQIGCPVGCRFCASGLGGLDGNLSAGRIVEQVWRLGRLQGVERITNVVFMGMGEPLANIANVIRAVRTIQAEWGLGISARKITISTVGLPAAIDRLANELDLPVTLALSLHAPNDTIRRELIPWASYTTIADLLTACQRWFTKTGREITLEYTLLRGVNDRPEHAAELATITKSLRANVNLIRYNEVKGMPFERPRTDDVLEFQRLLRARNVNAHIRASRGREIAAACGQLRHEHSGSGGKAGAGAKG